MMRLRLGFIMILMVIKIVVYFAAYYDNGRFVEKKCQLIIEKWEYAKSKLSVDNRYKDLEDHIGIISMILDMHIADKKIVFNGEYIRWSICRFTVL